MQHQARTRPSPALEPFPPADCRQISQRPTDPVRCQLLQVLGLGRGDEAAPLAFGKVDPEPVKTLPMCAAGSGNRLDLHSAGVAPAHSASPTGFSTAPGVGPAGGDGGPKGAGGGPEVV